MNRQRAPLFLHRSTYRRRRLLDGARVLPVLGLILILLPILWTRNSGDGIAGEAIYFFALWAGLIITAALLARPLRRAQALGDRDTAQGPAATAGTPQTGAAQSPPLPPAAGMNMGPDNAGPDNTLPDNTGAGTATGGGSP